MAPSILYTACLLGSVALYLLLRPGPRSLKLVAVLLGLGALGWIIKASAVAVATPVNGPEAVQRVFFFLFSLIAIASAVRMITHHRPVYAALYFVMVVLSSAGLFLLLEAEFMAFALVIVYAGAILITYLFVLMLAHQVSSGNGADAQPDYDRIPREPGAAAVVGFIMLAVLSDMIFSGTAQLPAPPSAEQVRARAWGQLDEMTDRLHEAVRGEVGEFTEIIADDYGRRIRIDGGEAVIQVLAAEDDSPQTVILPDEAMPQNIEQVGLALIAKFPVSLELAGVILLMAMFGAVVLAQRQIQLTEDEKRAAAGLGRFNVDEPEADRTVPPVAGAGP